MKDKYVGARIIVIGIVLAIAGILWAQAPIRGLCPMNFRSVDAYDITLISPPLDSGSAWNRTWNWAPDESIARIYGVLSALLAYNIAGLIYLRRKRTKTDTANNELESIVA